LRQGHVPFGERTGRRQDRRKIAQAAHHDSERRHQLFPLVGQISGEHRLDPRRDLEQAVVKKDRGLVGDRRHFREALLHKFNLVRCHVFLLLVAPALTAS